VNLNYSRRFWDEQLARMDRSSQAVLDTWLVRNYMITLVFVVALSLIR
jgi:hypothetical protein